MNFKLKLFTLDNQPVGNTTLEDFLADNEGAPTSIREMVAGLPLGHAATIPQLDLVVVRPAAVMRAAKRIARFKVTDLNIDGLKEATISINKTAGTIAVRFKRRRQLYELPLSDVAALIYDRVCRANAGVGRMKARRPRR